MATQHTITNPDFPTGLLRLEDGTVLDPPLEFGPFVLRKLVRHSNMSLLCLGIHTGTGEEVAVKICLPTADRARFKREIEHTQSIKMEGVIKIKAHDVGVTKDGCRFYATRWINGPNLGEFLRDKHRPLEAKLRALEELCRIVGVLHEKGLSHRDLKPSNVMVEEEGRRIVLLDLGQARSDGDETLTITGVHVGGTPGYYPCWSLDNTVPIKEFEKQWDVYSLAVMLVEALTGVRPAGDRDANMTPDGVKKLLNKQLPSDRRFDDLLAQCLAPKPEDCLRDADALYNRLRDCLGLSCRTPRWALSKVVLRLGLGLGVLAGGLLAFPKLAPESWTSLTARLRVPAPGTTAAIQPPALPTNTPPPRDPRIIEDISRTNHSFLLTVSPTGPIVRLVDHGANGQVVTNFTAMTNHVQIILPDRTNAQYSLEVFKSGYHPQTHAVDTNTGPMVVRLDRLRGEVEFRSTPGTLINLRHESGETRTAGPVPADGKLLVQSLDEGDWDWRMDHPDYETGSGKITALLYGKPQTVDRPLRPLPGRLSVVGHPTIQVWEGTNRLWPTNDWISLPAGPHDLTLRRPGFRPQTLRVDIPPNRDLSRVASNFVAKAGTICLYLDVRPAAEGSFAKAAKKLILDGAAPVAVNAFPHQVNDLAVGPHTLRVEVEGFVPVEQKVEIQDNQTNDLRLALSLQPARLTIVSHPAEADVCRPNGERLGRAGTELEVPPLEQLELEIRASAPSWQTARVFIPALPPGGTHRQEVRLTLLAVVAMREKPWKNTLGMRFVPVPGTKVLFCVWETRVQDYEAFVKATQREWERPSFDQGPDHPAVNVSWEDAKAFCKWLTDKERAEGKLRADEEYRLPTDAEWSAAVGLPEEVGATPRDKDEKIKDVYPWGKWPPPVGAGNYAESLKVDTHAYTSPVGSFAPNRFGIFDLGGNVWERCEDEYYPGSGSRVLRGGSWLSSGPDNLLSSLRNIDSPDYRFGNVGFRCVVGGASVR
jgi:serine/threonine protein kinase